MQHIELDINSNKTQIAPPFTKSKAIAKVQMAEDAWNTKNPQKVSQAYSKNSRWRNRDKFLHGRDEITAFLTKKWQKEKNYKLKKQLWSFTKRRISVRFVYEWQDVQTNQWFRTHGNEHWEFNLKGLMTIRDMSANEIEIEKSERIIY
jgi:nuclear transport factor 2 (NTF2) superfamily protein